MLVVGGLFVGDAKTVRPPRPLSAPLSARQERRKRALDLLVAPVLLVLATPLLALLALAICLDSRGSPFFGQDRVGAGGRLFRCYKLRTMAVGAEADDRDHHAYVAALIRGEGQQHDGVYKLADRRVTRVGRALRRYSLDELPQLWNVVRGDMSLVGPRPPMPSEVELYDERAWLRLKGRPGLTGAWQVGGRCLVGFHEMVALDLAYWDGWSLARDLKILLLTPIAVFSARGAA